MIRISHNINKLYLGYGNNNMYDKALNLFERVPFELDYVIYTVVFNVCAQLCDDRAKQIGNKLLHQMPKHFRNNNNLLTSAIDMLMRFGDVKEAEHLFDTIKKKDIISYGAMMNGYNINNEPVKSLTLFKKLKEDGMVPDLVISVILIGACARIGMVSTCQSIVGQLPLHFYDNQHICSSLIDMWASIDFENVRNNRYNLFYIGKSWFSYKC